MGQKTQKVMTPERKKAKAEYLKAWRAANKERCSAQAKKDAVKYEMTAERKLAAWMRNLYRNYNLSAQGFNEMWEAQNGKCAICEVKLSPRGKTTDSVCVDHNHSTGEVRGLLCRSCNSGIGSLKDSPEVLAAALRYLNKYGNYCSQTKEMDTNHA